MVGANKMIGKLEKQALEIFQDFPIINELPASVSGKHHIGETARQHIQTTVHVMKHLCLEFNVPEEDQDLLIASAWLHDIGGYPLCVKGKMDLPHWHYYDTGFSRLDCFFYLHPVLSAEIINGYEIDRKEEIKRLVSVHMSHWYKDCPQPDLTKLYEVLICTADYVASKGDGMFFPNKRI
ncbi:hypothetical protein LCGC14_2167600 [marine sediment metagenome]|uniref:HD domain-containing protein n=1 Tax=marine sediment metagenome TaxID=412755 RepID=A0A0F9G3L8_9ZZZZ